MSSTWQTDDEYAELTARLRPRLTEEFLNTLAAAAEITLSDTVEVDGFVVEMFDLAGKEPPERFRK